MSAVISISKNLYKHKLTKQENVKEKKTFFCDMKFTDVRQALMKRKWILKRISKNNISFKSKNTNQKEKPIKNKKNRDDEIVDFLWTNYRRVNFEKIQAYQYVNHLQGVTELSIKSNLWSNLSKNDKIRLPFTVVVKNFDAQKKDIFAALSITVIDGENHLDANNNSKNNVADNNTINNNNNNNKLSNTYIIKPVSSSRGRGIEIVSNLNDLESHLKVATEEKPMIIQKYISNPSLINKFKFDIRLWVLVSSIDPLRIYTFNEPYARLSNFEFTMSDNNKLIHLTNNSIQNKQDDMLRTAKSKEKDAKMFSYEQLMHYYGEDVWKTIIYKQMKRQTYLTINEIVPLLKTTGKGFELFGFDYMLDDDLNIYLIEVNLDPDQSHSTNVTRNIVPKCINGIIDIVTNNTNGALKKDDKNENTDVDNSSNNSLSEYWDKLESEDEEEV